MRVLGTPQGGRISGAVDLRFSSTTPHPQTHQPSPHPHRRSGDAVPVHVMINGIPVKLERAVSTAAVNVKCVQNKKHYIFHIYFGIICTHHAGNATATFMFCFWLFRVALF